jgi:recombination associated protein RdgC
LVQCVEGLALRLLQTTLSPAVAMTAWLSDGEPPAGFSVDRECELKSADEMKSVVRYARHPLDTDEVRAHVQVGGKQPTRLALTWRGRVSFVLTDSLQIKKLSVDDGLFDAGKGRDDDGFDADAVIATGELRELIPDLVAALDGELAVDAGERRCRACPRNRRQERVGPAAFAGLGAGSRDGALVSMHA